MGIGHAQTLCGKFIHVGCLDFRRTVTTKIAVADVIGKDVDDVGFGGIVGGVESR